MRTLDGVDTAVKDGATLILLPGHGRRGWRGLRRLAPSLLDLVGNTPLVELPRISPKESVRIYAKLEGQNPTGSIKDRVAQAMIEAAEASGDLEPGPRAARADLRQHRHLAGADREAEGLPDHLRDARERDAGADQAAAALRREGRLLARRARARTASVQLALELAEQDPRYFMPFQYGNEANPRAHYEGTGAEIAEALDRVDVLVAGLGTGGTLMGTGERLRESFPDVVVAAAEPMPGDPVMGLRSLEDGYIAADPRRREARPEAARLERRVGRRACTRCSTREGIFAGVSSGAVIHVARRLAEELDEGVVVCVLADGGWKYLSASFWDEPTPTATSSTARSGGSARRGARRARRARARRRLRTRPAG